MAYATKCPCGSCSSWHVEPQAAIQGVSFTEREAREVADTLNGLSRGADCTYVYFKPSGKFYAMDRGKWPLDSTSRHTGGITRSQIMIANGGCLPGLMEGSRAETFRIIVLPDDSCTGWAAYPRIVEPGE